MIFMQMRENERQARRTAVRALVAQARPFPLVKVAVAALAFWIVVLALLHALRVTLAPYA